MTSDELPDQPLKQQSRSLSLPPASVPPLVSQRSQLALPASSSSVSILDVTTVLRHWWWKCLLLGTVAAIVSGSVVWLTHITIYEASAWMEIKERPIYVAFELQQNANASLFFKTQLQTIQSPVVLAKVSAEPKIARLAEVRQFDTVLEWLQQGLKASFRGESELCEVSFRAQDPATAEMVANAVMEAYLALHRDQLGQQSERIIELLTEEKRRRSDEVEQLQERVRVLVKKVMGNDAPLSGHKELVVVQNPITALEVRRTAVEVERLVLEAKLKAYQEVDLHKLTVPEDAIKHALEANPEIIELKTQLAGANAKLRELQRRTKSEDNPTVKKLAATVQSIEAALEKARQELRPKLSEELRVTMLAKRSDMLTNLQTDVGQQRQLQHAWQERIDATLTDQRQKSEAADDQSLELEFARGELGRSEEVFQKIADRIIALRTEMRAPLRTSVLQRATKPVKPIEAIPYKRFAIAFLGSFAVPFGLAFFWERRLRRVSDASQIAAQVSLPVLGEVTALPKRSLIGGARSADRLLRDRLTFEESIDALRVGLTRTPDYRDLRTLAVTSAISREGKTSLSYALALSLANASEEPILLIDADMQAPDLHDMLGIPLEPGLAEVLGGQCPLDEAVFPYAAEGIHLLPAGRLKASPHMLLRNDAFPSLLAKLRSRYRYIVIDAPPVLAASEAVVIAGSADGTLVCTMRDLTRGPQLQMTCQKLTSAGARLLGAVINGVPARSWVYKYGGYAYAQKRHSSRDVEDKSLQNGSS